MTHKLEFFTYKFLLYFTGLFDEPAKSLTDVAMLHNTVKSIYDWRCVVLGLEAESPMQTFFLGIFTFHFHTKYIQIVFRYNTLRMEYS